MCLYHQTLRSLFIYIFLPALLAITVVLGGVGGHTGAAAPSNTIRVAIFKSAPSITVTGVDLQVRDENGNLLDISSPVKVSYAVDAVVVDRIMYRKLSFIAAGDLRVNNRPYRGKTELSADLKGLLAVNELPLEEYLIGLINSEISSAWPIEAVKAQAVIARTYALHRKAIRRNQPYHLESTVMDQVYHGVVTEDSRAARAVSDTAGEVLTYDNEIIEAFYHSSCGGRTEASVNVWGKQLPYLKGVSCEYCLYNSNGTWEKRLTLKELEDKLRAGGYKVSAVSDVVAGARNSRGRVRDVIVSSQRGDLVLSGDKFRKAIGYSVIKSTNFVVNVSDGRASFSGYGNGHGVGLCQWGAKQRALNGFNYMEILSYYYPGTQLEKHFESR